MIKTSGSELTITNVLIPSKVDVVVGGDITIMGQGFANEDKFLLTPSSNLDKENLINTSAVTNEKAIFTLPVGVVTGEYSITVVRGDKRLLLGSFMLNIIVDDTSIPDIKGMTIKGVISSEGIGIEGVEVSNGYEVTTTNVDGIYYLPSTKKNRYVFISVPSNYEVSNNKSLPQFFKRLYGGASVEQKDFVLTKTDNSKHVV